MIGSGVERLNKEFGISRSGHATVTASNFAIMSLEIFSEKAQRSEDLKPGELPD